MGSGFLKNTGAYLGIALIVIGVFYLMVSNQSSSEIAITEVISLAQDDRIENITVDGNNLTVTTNDYPPQKFTSRKESDSSMVDILQNAGVTNTVKITVKGASGVSNFLGIIINFLPLIFFGAILLFMMRQAQGTGSQAMSFGRSRARVSLVNKPGVTFGDVAGADEAKLELEEVVEFLKHAERFLSLGAKIPRGVLLVGPPGTGKTLLAKAVAGEAGVPFFSISGSEFVEMFVGVGAARVRDLFDQAKKNSPAIVFVDEIDAVGRHRGAGLGGGHDEREQTLNQILVEIDGFDSTSNVIVIAATNRPDILDPALLRPGRFDRRVTLDLPDIAGRQAILKVHSQGKPIDNNVNLEVVAKETPGFSGADLANLVNEAAILTARRKKTSITFDEFGESIDRVLLGPERKSRIISHLEREITAYHEAGHTIVGHLLPDCDPVQKVSIVSRGMAGGYTKSIPAEDRHMYSLDQFKSMMAMAMGGRVAEQIIFEKITTGASNDLENATRMARNMVVRYGMSENLGPRTFGEREEMVFLGRQISEQRDYSDNIAQQIDEEVKSLVTEAYDLAHSMISKNRAKLVQLARHLLTHETVEGEELITLLDSEAPPIESEVTHQPNE